MNPGLAPGIILNHFYPSSKLKGEKPHLAAVPAPSKGAQAAPGLSPAAMCRHITVHQLLQSASSPNMQFCGAEISSSEQPVLARLHAGAKGTTENVYKII